MNVNPPAWLALAVFLSACTEKAAVVTLSGAVARPGPYAHNQEWSMADYVAAAGGYTAEAVVSEGRLIRVLRDSLTGEETSRSWWPLVSSPVVFAGDLIFVPFRTYEVQMDTVRPVENLNIQWKDREYRVPQAWLAEGRTDSGVMVASVIGTGTVVGSEKGETLGRFQYLYLHLHPRVYDELALPAGNPVESDLILEDAVGVHQSIFPRLRHRSGVRAEMPPDGYLRVLAGVWPKPGSKTMPGSGMRKRNYRDGREWTTFPDGRQRMVFPDGRVEVELPDGSRENRHADGRIEMTDSRGNVRVTHPDGRRAVAFADGNREERFADGRIVQYFKTGTSRTIFPDGSEKTRFEDGTLHVRRRNGTVEMTFPEGMKETRHADGRIVAVTGEGHRITVFPNGRRLTRTRDGTVLEEFADGRRVQRGPDGERVEVFIDGTRRTSLKDGSSVIEQPDGVRVERHADGLTVEMFPDGREVQTGSDGVRLEAFPDGRKVQTDVRGNRLETFPDGRRLQSDSEGNQVEAFPDGTRIRTFVNGYRYWGTVRDGLAEVDETPEGLPPGSRLRVAGALSSDVDELLAAIFRLPDGNVFELPVVPEEGRFSCVFPDSVLTASGHYRVQVLAKLPGESVVVADRPLIIGNPSALEKMVLAIVPFRGADDARSRLSRMINAARGRLGLPALETHPRLMDAAGARLWDVLSSSGPAAEPMAWGAESITRGPSVEEVFTYMMHGAAQRHSILNGEWKHMGLAVDQDGEDIVVVVIFDNN
ncbi:MAG: hypothetical protein OXU79_08305 [Gemmatimonadota bacterium]|nr:hypothetical protein [Gemmatimonadota bacterium]